MIARILDWLAKRWQCIREGHNYRFTRNIYGDEIIWSGGKRSIWRCRHCGGSDYRDTLFSDEERAPK